MLMRKILQFRCLLLPLSFFVLAFFSALSAKAAHAALIPEPLPRINTTFANDEFYQPKPNEPVLLKGTLYFVLDTAPYGAELWRTDGTAAGTTLVKDLYPGRIGGVRVDLVVVGDALYFVGDDGTVPAIWRYDGSEFQKIDLEVLSSSEIREFVAVGDALYVSARVGTDAELWRVTGTTVTKIDLNPKGPSTPTRLAAVGDGLYVTAYLANIGERLIYIEGTTPTVIDFGEDTPFIYTIGVGIGVEIMAAGDIAYVTTARYQDGLVESYGLWQIADATATNTEVVTDATFLPTLVTVVDDSLYFLKENVTTRGIWRYDGTTAIPIQLDDGNNSATYVAQVNGALYFFVSNVEIYPTELWRVEGATASKVPITVNSEVARNNLAVVGNTLYIFFARLETTELWKIEGITPTMIQTYPPDNGVSDLTAVGDRLWVRTRMRPNVDLPYSNSYFYSSVGIGYSEYDGERFNALNGPIGTSSNPSEYAALGDDLYFSAFDGTDVELWHLHENAVVKIDINAGDDSSYPSKLVAVGNALYLQATDGTGTGLWQVIANTPVKIDLEASDIGPFDFIAVDGAIYVTRYNNATPELYRVDGVNLTKINIEGATGLYELTAVGTVLYIVVNTNSAELWQVKGTTATRISSPENFQWIPLSLTAQGDTLYIVATNNVSSLSELWRVKETTITRLPIPGSSPLIVVADSTIFLADLGLCGSDSPNTPATIWRVKGENVAQVDFNEFYCVKELTAVGDALYLSAEVNFERELWQVTDTQVSKIDINPGGASSDPTDLTVMGDTLYLSAFDGTDRELWRVRGLNRFEADIFEGNGSGGVSNIYATPSKLYFSAWGSTSSGAELWTVTEVDSSVFLPGIQK